MSDDPTPTPPNTRLKIIIAVAVLIGAIILLIVMERASRVEPAGPAAPPKSGGIATPIGTSEVASSTSVEPAQAPGPTAARAFASGLDAPPDRLPGTSSTLADGLLDSAGDPHRDLAIIGTLLTHYVGEFHEMPVGNNAEITAALAGDNPRAYAALPPDHRAINGNGELTDRWGTPFFFHQQARDRMEILSAGPDRRRFTADDMAWPTANTAPVEEPATVAEADM